MFVHNIEDMPHVGDIFPTITDMDNSHEDREMNRGSFRKFANPDIFSDTGLVSCGRQFGFPADFVRSISETDALLAHDIMMNRFMAVAEKGVVPIARMWNGCVEGVVSPSYNYCDDVEVFTPIMQNPALNTLAVARYDISPSYTSVQMLFPEAFHVAGDPSPLYWGVNVINSMTGLASVVFNLFIWRQVCSNGLCIPAQSARFVKRVHRGYKDIAAELEESMAFIAEKKENILQELLTAADAPAKILAMKEEHRQGYLARQLNIGEKEVQNIMDLFATTYGGETRWGFAQAISEYARDLANPMKRDALERRALLVA